MSGLRRRAAPLRFRPILHGDARRSGAKCGMIACHAYWTGECMRGTHGARYKK
jgi:hypothetical protein